MNELQQRITSVRQRIARAAAQAGKTEAEITLVGVSKTFPVEMINAAVELGLTHIGENRIQEARTKFPQVTGRPLFHMIGHLQRNKVKYAVKLFDLIQSLDSISLAEEIEARCSKLGKTMPVLLEVNTSGEEAKEGCAPSEAITLLKAIDRLPHLCVEGFMTVALYSEDPELVRPCFRQLRGIYEEGRSLNLERANLKYLSMGMSNDFELAIAEGANMVRVGSAIFGDRRNPA